VDLANKIVFVSGCFDLLHSGHVRFLQQAAQYGNLHVSIGSDESIRQLKLREPICSQQERLFMIQSLQCVNTASISHEVGTFDYVNDLKLILPDMFVVNEDGDHPKKRELCEQLEIEYIVLLREPFPGLPSRSTTALSASQGIPYRIDIAGGWLDQPFVSQLSPGSMVVASVIPNNEYEHRSGMATSTRWNAPVFRPGVMRVEVG